MRVLTLFTLALLVAAGCATEDGGGPFAEGGHLVSGGVPPGGISALNSPPRMPGSQMTFQDLEQSDRVVGVFINGQAMAYPIKVMDWHEVANDVVGGQRILLSYCPLTATSIAFDPRISAGDAIFGVSGLLCDNNLVMFDRVTQSLWPQMGFESIRGDLLGESLEQIPVLETTWNTWLGLHPDTEVLDISSQEVASNLNYAIYPYGTYFTSTRVSFPLRNVDARMHPKLRVHGIKVNGETRVYPITEFSGLEAHNETLGGEAIVVFGNPAADYAMSFYRTVAGQTRTFEMTQSFPPRIRDLETGTVWDIHGTAISGPDTGQQLTPTRSFTGFWFAWSSFEPGLEIWER
jgi:hypothetical protein